MNPSEKQTNKQHSPYETYVKLTGIIMLVFGVFFVLLDVQAGVNLFDAIDNIIATYIDLIKNVSSQPGIAEMNLVSEEQISQLEAMMYSIKDYVPVIITVFSMIAAFILQWIAYKVNNMFGQQKKAFPPFRNLNFPKGLLWIYLLMIIVIFINLDGGSVLFLAVINIYALLSFFMVIQGFSFIFHFAYVRKIHVVVPILLLIVFLFINVLMVFVQILGIIDVGFSLKKRITDKYKK